MLRTINYLRRRYWTTVVVAATLPGASAAAIEFVVTNGVQGPWPIGTAIAGGVLTAVVLRFVQIPELTQTHSGAETVLSPDSSQFLPSKTGGRFFSPRSLDELVGELEGQTSIVAREVSKRHIGHWLRVRGRISDVSEYEDWIWVHISPLNSDIRLMLEFTKKSWHEKLVAYNAGDEISAIGKITSIEKSYRGYIELEDCELQPQCH